MKGSDGAAAGWRQNIMMKQSDDPIARAATQETVQAAVKAAGDDLVMRKYLMDRRQKEAVAGPVERLSVSSAVLGNRGVSSRVQEEENESDEDLLNDPELDRLYQNRVHSMKETWKKEQKMQQIGHGSLRRVEEQQFLEEVMSSQYVVCSFFHRDFERCAIMDHHLVLLAQQHTETKFIALDAEKSPFFVNKLGIRTLPTVVLFHDGVVVDRLIGFSDLGGRDDFKTKALELRLAQAGLIALHGKRAKVRVPNTKVKGLTDGIL